MTLPAKSAGTAFRTEEKGAVTIDWVVLTGALVGLVIVVAGIINDSLVEGAAERAIVPSLQNANGAADRLAGANQ